MEHQLEALMELADRLGVEVRQEPLAGQGGGLCCLRGRRVLFIDSTADLAEQVAQAVGGLAGVAGIEDHYVPPQVRELLDRAGGSRPAS